MLRDRGGHHVEEEHPGDDDVGAEQGWPDVSGKHVGHEVLDGVRVGGGVGDRSGPTVMLLVDSSVQKPNTKHVL